MGVRRVRGGSVRRGSNYGVLCPMCASVIIPSVYPYFLRPPRYNPCYPPDNTVIPGGSTGRETGPVITPKLRVLLSRGLVSAAFVRCLLLP